MNGFMHGVRIVEDKQMVERVPFPRSPARAKRRARKGHPQHMTWRPMKKIYQLRDGTMVMHPTIAKEIRAELHAKGVSA